ncbi:MAG: SPOR domain-containing protein [Treponema sp.]|nr:SPOR domain-containing protein [Candidatus Treponema equifaecale]
MFKKFLVTALVFVASLGLFAEEWYVCAGSFKNQNNSKNRCQVLDEKGFPTFEGVVKTSDSSSLYRVFIDKAFKTEALAVAYKNSIVKNSDVSKIDKANLWCVRYDGPKNKYVFVKNGKNTGAVKEIIKEVPVIKEVIKEVPVEKIVEVVKEVPVVKEVEVIKEVPVEKIVEVVKEVPVEKIVEVVKEVQVPAPALLVEPETPAEEPQTEETAPAAEEPAPEAETPAEPEAPAEEAPAEVEQPAEIPAEVEAPVEETPAEPEPAPSPVEDMNVEVSNKSLLVKDADTGVPVAGATVNMDDGKWVLTTDESGTISLPAKIKKGNHQLLITHDDYVTTEQLLEISKKGEIVSGNQISVPRKVEYERIKIVLDWGTYPQDLDANIVTEGKRVYYKEQDVAGIRLDRDDKDSYGPETITLENMDPSKKYSYYVTDYSDEGNVFTNYLSKSNAKVTVYKNNDFYRSFVFDHPTNGVTWHVFDVVENGIVEVNEITTDLLVDIVNKETAVDAK